MPSNTASRWREKPVLVAVYVETPRKRRFIKNSGQHHHQNCHLHHHHHLFVHQKPRQGGGYNRRSELLDYSRRLRESAKSTPLLLQQPKPTDSLQRSRSQIIPVQNKLRPARVLTCFGILPIILPGFSGAKRERKKKSRNDQSIKAKMKSIVKTFQVRKKGGFLVRLFGSLRRKR